MMGSNRNFCLSRDVLQINFLTMEKGTLVVCVVVALRIRVCSTRKRQEWVRMWWCHVEKCKFVLQNSLLLTDLCGIHPSRVMGPALVFTWRIWPVTALHLVLRCHAALLLQKSRGLWRFLTCHRAARGFWQQLTLGDTLPSSPSPCSNADCCPAERVVEVPGNGHISLSLMHLSGVERCLSSILYLKADTITIGSNLPLL